MTEGLAAGVLDAAPVAILWADAAGRILGGNTAAETLFGYRRDELTGQSLEWLLPGAFPARTSGQTSGVTTESGPEGTQRRRLSVRRKDGGQFPAELSVSVADDPEGHPMVVAAVVAAGFTHGSAGAGPAAAAGADHGDRAEGRGDRAEGHGDRSREEANERWRHEQRRLAGLAQLAGGVAHDFNNLLSIILNYSSFIAEVADDGLAEGTAGRRWQVVHDDITQIQVAAQRATGLTRKLLSFARRDGAQPRAVHVNEVLAALEARLAGAVGAGTELLTDLAAGLWPAQVDPLHLEEVVVNLVSNAGEATPDGGVVLIDTSNVLIDPTAAAGHPDLRGGPYVRLRVSDSGTGMGSDVIGNIFDPFFTTKVRSPGAGLGLSIVHGAVSGAGGQISVYSEPGLGSTFSVLLPVATVPDPHPEDAPAPGGGGQLVLVVDDDAALRQIVERILAANGYQVRSAADGAAAAQLAGVETVDVALIDVVLPDMPGPAVARSITEGSSDLAVVLMSGYPQALLAARGQVGPGTPVLEKPFSETDLLVAVGRALGAGGRRDGVLPC